MKVQTQVDSDILDLLDEISDRHKICHLFLHNDDVHSMDEVAHQLILAIGCSKNRAWELMARAHFQGKALILQESRFVCEKAAAILAKIDLSTSITEID